MVVRVRVAGTGRRVGVLDCTKEVKGSVGGGGSHPDSGNDHFVQ